MKILIAGSGGQLGRALQATAPAAHSVVAPPEAEFDITDEGAVAAAIGVHKPDLVINAAAYTAVDKAEADAVRARLINATAVEYLATQAPALVQISTDFVFDGTAHRPIPPEARPNPLSVYGATKRAGELAALANPRALVVRTAWVYAAQGGNFVRTMLRLMAERPELAVVSDQIGTPTHAASLARAIWALVGARATGLHHFTDAGVASWHDFAVAIQEEALALGLLAQPVPVRAIMTADYPTPAARPHYGVLDKTATWAITGQPDHWRTELRACLREMMA
ncbi:dTDP-4-dehydrorhamnose reductase [Polymorphobacter sp.]|uniref:dTDP-4-dehydrorhamnose reductase n=1 Tax=Polymorphobacter sp. TaxID=1909290 RepID=UPI003F705D8E